MTAARLGTPKGPTRRGGPYSAIRCVFGLNTSHCNSGKLSQKYFLGDSYQTSSIEIDHRWLKRLAAWQLPTKLKAERERLPRCARPRATGPWP